MKYGILDDEGNVIRWVYDKPSDQYEFISVKIPRKRKPKVDKSTWEPALI